MNKVVISHYNEDLSWLKNVKNNNITIVSKTLTSNTNIIYQEKNIGNEASAYLKYIIDDWDNLKTFDNCIFLHGHQTSWHQSHSADFLINYFEDNKTNEIFINFGDNNFYEIYPDKVTQTGRVNYVGDNRPYLILRDVWNKLFESLGTLPEYITLNPGAQFLVNTDNIVSRGREFYINCYEWIMNENNTTYSSQAKGVLFEWLWHFIFTGQPITTTKKII
jgi:hypothetical protein